MYKVSLSKEERNERNERNERDERDERNDENWGILGYYLHISTPNTAVLTRGLLRDPLRMQLHHIMESAHSQY